MTPSEPVRIATITLPGTECAVAQARGYARDIFGPHHPALADMQICISEGFTNAIRHTLSGLGGKITVTFSPSEQARIVALALSGTGMPREAMKMKIASANPAS